MALLQKGYLGSTPLWRDILWYEGSPGVLNDSAAATITASATAHTKGAWTQIIASTSANSSYIHVDVSGVGAAGVNTAMLLDIATGASGSETAIVSNIAIGAASSVWFSFPFKLASGTRLSARIQAVVTSDTAFIRLSTINAGDYDNSPTSVDVIGGDTATSEGIRFSGASGTWVQATASTSRAYRAVAIVLSGHDATMANVLNASYDVGVGASGSEISFGTCRHGFTANELSTSSAPYLHLFGRSIPSGSRLAVKHPIGANPERYGFNLIGIP